MDIPREYLLFLSKKWRNLRAKKGRNGSKVGQKSKKRSKRGQKAAHFIIVFSLPVE